MARYGPLTKDTTTVALGLAQIRVGASSTNIAKVNPQLTSTNSLGAMASTKLTCEAEYFTLESGFPLLPDAEFPLRESAMMEVAFKEMTPQNIAFAKGIDATTGYAEAHSGEVVLGDLSSPAYVRMEAVYTYPDKTNKMYVIFPRAQIKSSLELDLQAEEPAASPMSITAQRADSEASGGHAVWDDKPLGRIQWTES